MGYTDDHGIATLAAAGGNTFRTWETQHLDTQLEAARRHGLMVLIGLDTGKQLSGFDYTDANAVADQYARMTTIIERYRNHPNVLGWILANEPNLVFDESGAPAVAHPAVYDALGQLVDYLQENDPALPGDDQLCLHAEPCTGYRNGAQTCTGTGFHFSSGIRCAVGDSRARVRHAARPAIHGHRIRPTGGTGRCQLLTGAARSRTQWSEGGRVHRPHATGDLQRLDRKVDRCVRFPVGTETGTHTHLVRHVHRRRPQDGIERRACGLAPTRRIARR